MPLPDILDQLDWSGRNGSLTRNAVSMREEAERRLTRALAQAGGDTFEAAAGEIAETARHPLTFLRAWNATPGTALDAVRRWRMSGDGAISMTPVLALNTRSALFQGEEEACYVAYGEDQAVTAGKVFSAGLEHATGSPSTGEFVGTCLRIVAIRADTMLEDPTSSSWRTAPGLAGLTNPHASGWSVPWLANALVHEAIHAALYFWELEEPLCQPIGQRITSPWTGSSLRLQSYLHACLVWYGLAHYWARPDADKRCEKSEALSARARRGFRHRPWSPLQELNVRLRVGVVDMIRDATDRVQALAQ